MRTIVLNSSYLVQDGQNNKFLYKFPNSVLFKGNSIALSSVSMYYSWFNITAALGNNKFSYEWTNGATTTTYNLTIPDGLYEISDLNAFLQFNFIQNNQYLVNSSGQNVYYAEFIVNPTRYAIQINTFLVPTSLPSGYTNPAALVFPTQTFNPIITIPTNLNLIFGFSSTYSTPSNVNNAYTPPSNQTLITKNGFGTISCLSNQSPQLQPNPSVYIGISNINNPYSIPNTILYSVIPTGAIGSLIQSTPPQFTWNPIIDGTTSQLLISILGSNLQPIPLNDPQTSIILVIKDADEAGIK